MDNRKFKVGQLVAFGTSRNDREPEIRRSYKILQLLPCKGADFTYRVKTITEPTHRVAREAEIELF